MKKLFFELTIILLALLVAGCTSSSDYTDDRSPEGTSETGSDLSEENSKTPDESGAPSSDKSDGTVMNEYILKATVCSVGDVLTVEVIESDYAFGTYIVLISDSTVYESATGDTLSLTDISIGDTVEITYGGQVMMSYPPQIVGKRVRLI